MDKVLLFDGGIRDSADGTTDSGEFNNIDPPCVAVSKLQSERGLRCMRFTGNNVANQRWIGL